MSNTQPDSAPLHRVNVLCADEGSMSRVEAMLADANLAEIHTQLAHTRVDVRDAIPLQLGEDPLSGVVYLANSQSDETAAIEAGADEALWLQGCSQAELGRLVRRAAVRAQRRGRDEAIQQAAAQKEKLSSIGALIAGVSHDIRGPCMTIVLSAGLLKLSLEELPLFAQRLHQFVLEDDGIGADELAKLYQLFPKPAEFDSLVEAMDDAEKCAKDIGHLARDLQLIVRDDPRESAVRVDLRNLLNRVLRVAARNIENFGTLERDYDPDLPPVGVFASRLTQVCTNLVSNAVDAMQSIERPVHRLKVSTRGDAEGIVITISDSGPGVPQDLQEQIFDPFFTTKEKGKGTGLGLATSRRLVERMGGELMLESEPGVGAQFMIFLPTLDIAEEDGLGQRKAQREAVRYTPPASSPRLTILVVDDDERILRSYARTLRTQYDVLLATDGREAQDLLQAGCAADAIVCDLNMPEVDGASFHQWLKSHSPYLAYGVLFVTANPSAARAALTLPDGSPAVVLDKPVDREALLGSLSSIFRSRPVARPVRPASDDLTSAAADEPRR